MSGKQEGSFLDSKSILAVVLVGVSWFFWDAHMKKKYPHLNKPAVKTESTVSNEATSKTVTKSSTNSTETSKLTNNNQSSAKLVQEQSFSFKSGNINFEISNYGMGIKNIYLNKYLDRNKEIKQIKTDFSVLPFETRILGENVPLVFNIEQVTDFRFKGVATYNGVTIVKTLEVQPDNYSLKMKVNSNNISSSFKGLKFYLSTEIDENSGSSLLMPTLGGQELFVKYENTSDRLIGPDMGEKVLNVKNASLVNLGETYFSLALLNESSTIPSFNNEFNGKEVLAQLSFPVLNADNNSQELILDGFLGPKDVDVLASIHPGLSEVIDYGWFDVIARGLLKLLKFLNSFIGNWGFSIVLMTLLIKALLLPLNIVSFRSMKRMQKIQPKIKEIRAQYKDKPQEMNLKVMALMKEQKANPLSGCLPTVLQFPIFFALYRVLGQSIDLYQAPFIFWIQDLSLKDPFYILPVLMGVAMFFQMKISPSTMDPMQKKIMMFMPIMFSLFMLALPSGLTLYIFVSTLFGIIQHFIFMREPSPSAVLSKA